MKINKKMTTAAVCILLYLPLLSAQSKSPSYSASGAFSTPVDAVFNPGSFHSIKFDTLFAYTGINSRYLDIGAAFRFGNIYTALGYSGNVFDFTGMNLLALNVIKPRRVSITPNTEPGNLQRPLFSNKAILIIGAEGLQSAYFKNIGFKFTVETLSAKHTKEELYGKYPLTVAPLNPLNPIRFGFKDTHGTPVKTDGTDKSAVRLMFDWSGFRFPIGSRTLTVKPFFGVDVNRSLSQAESVIPASRTKGVWNNGTTDLKAFLNTGYGEFSLNYYFSYKFFPRIPQRYEYRSHAEVHDTETAVQVNQSYDQKGRQDMINKITAGYKPSFKFADSTVLFTPSLSLACEIRSLTIPHTLITTEHTVVQQGAVNQATKRYIKEYTQKTAEQRITVSPVTALAVQYRIIKDKLALNAGINVQMDYIRTRKIVSVPSIGKVTGTLTAGSDGETYQKTTEPGKGQNSRSLTHRFTAKGSFGLGLQWHITPLCLFDTAFTVLTDFKNAAFTRENCNLAAALSVKL